MLRFFIFFSIYLATYAANAEHTVLGNDAKPVRPSGIQNTKNVAGKNDVVGDLKMNNDLGNMQTTARALGTTVKRYDNSATGNFQTVPQQNNRASNSNTIRKRRNSRRNNLNANRRNSPLYGSTSSPPSPSSSSSDSNNYWDGSSLNPNITFGLTFNGKKIPINVVRKPLNAADIDGSRKTSGFLFNPKITFNNDGLTVDGKKIPLDSLGNPLNAAHINDNGKKSVDLSTGINVALYDDGRVVGIGKKNPSDIGSSGIAIKNGVVMIHGKTFQGSSVNYNDVDGYMVDGKKVDVFENANSSNKDNSFNPANNIQNTK
ncbi:uncharacterized protein LOC126833004 [Adelges cooleyi]|uniref:uncharacterized protein LOC126833004 n=1 Tax=Adelges cooleyi TaxID=133065 RepID=UPI00218025DE|nr:uncharacterized protein LOC126833004 [Adelges cooleyi]